jgi:hypothetical protein
LFSLVLGGYGLFGIILNVQLHVVDNSMYRLEEYIIKSDEYIKKFDQLVNRQPNIGMVYGRININPEYFMEEAMLSVFTNDKQATLAPLKEAGFTALLPICAMHLSIPLTCNKGTKAYRLPNGRQLLMNCFKTNSIKYINNVFR